MLGLLKRLFANESGNFAVITAVAILPMAGLSGLAVDFSQAYSVRSTLQGEADAIALAVAAEGPTVASSRFYPPMVTAAKQRISLGETSFSGRWISLSDYEVVGTTKVPRTLSRLIPIGTEAIEVTTRSVVRYKGARLVHKPPASRYLDPHAWDYNRIYAYCYDKVLGETNRAAARTQRTEIANNVDGPKDNPMPKCDSSREALSFELYNVLEGKIKPSVMKSKNKTEYHYFTDTVLNRDASGNDIPTHDASVSLVLETVLCSSLEACVPGRSGIPNKPDSNRKPKTYTGECPKGMFLYYGWEDRPNRDGTGDFDDIRMVIECPELVSEGTVSVRLVH